MKEEKKVIRGYKGFDKDLRCRDFQYEVGKEYECDKAVICEEGFHFCENPLDVFYYYSPCEYNGLNRFCEVEGSGEFDRKNDKLCCTKIKIIRELTLQEFDEECRKYSIKKRKTFSLLKRFKLKDLFVKNYKKTRVIPNCPLVVNKRIPKFVDNVTDNSIVVNMPRASVVDNKGDYSIVYNIGNMSSVNNSGSFSLLANRGDFSVVNSDGFDSLIADMSDFSHVIASNKGAVSVTTGSFSLAAAKTEDSFAIAAGFKAKAKGVLGSWIVLAERDAWNGHYYPIKEVKAFKVDGETIKPDTSYRLVDGKPIEIIE